MDTFTLESDEDHSGKHASPVLGKWILHGHQQVKEIVILLLRLMMSGLFASLVGMETSKEEGILHSKLKGTFATARKK